MLSPTCRQSRSALGPSERQRAGPSQPLLAGGFHHRAISLGVDRPNRSTAATPVRANRTIRTNDAYDRLQSPRRFSRASQPRYLYRRAFSSHSSTSLALGSNYNLVNMLSFQAGFLQGTSTANLSQPLSLGSLSGETLSNSATQSLGFVFQDSATGGTHGGSHRHDIAHRNVPIYGRNKARYNRDFGPLTLRCKMASASPTNR